MLYNQKIAIKIINLTKFYNNNFKALNNINLEIMRGEIFALLGPNGAGKTTLINTICGISNFNIGSIKVFGYDNIKDYRFARFYIGLVPQELTTGVFESVFQTVEFSRGLFGKKSSTFHIENILNKLSLWEKRHFQIRFLSGGMKRRVMIAKALSHEPSILFLDEPTSGVDVELRQSMWNYLRNLKKQGISIVLTTHYIEEAEAIADTIGIINYGNLFLVENKQKLMHKLGKKRLIIHLYERLTKIPDILLQFNLKLINNGYSLIFTYDIGKIDNEISFLFDIIKLHKIYFRDIDMYKSSLEEIFVQLVKKK